MAESIHTEDAAGLPGPRSGVKREAFPKAERVRRRAEYVAVQGRGRKLGGPHLLFLYCVLAGDENLRVGVTVTRKIGNAVTRNRVKRWTREVYRRHKHWFPARGRLVVVARQGAESLDHEAFDREVKQLCERHFQRR